MTYLAHQLLSLMKRHWKRSCIAAALLLLTILPAIVFLFLLHLHISETIFLFGYILFVFLLLQKKMTLLAVLMVFTAGGTVDFFMLQPLYSFTIANPQEAWGLYLFVVTMLILIYLYTHMQHQTEQARQQESMKSAHYEKALHEKGEEASRRERELHLFAETVRNTRNEKELKHQLHLIAQAIDDELSTCGIHSCMFLLPDLEGHSLQPRIATSAPDAAFRSHEEEVCALWVLRNGRAVELRSMPPDAGGAREQYIRWLVENSSASSDLPPHEEPCSYLVPLLSRAKTIGGIRLLVEDVAHARFITMRRCVETYLAGGEPVQPELFLEFLKQAVSLIEQALIEQALRLQEDLRRELSRRTEELYASILSSISHDLKTPLALIKKTAESLHRQDNSWNDEETRRSFLAYIIEETNWLERLISRMLDMSRIEQGMLKLEKELYPFETVVLNTLDRGYLCTLLEGRAIDISGIEELPEIELDPSLIGQVLSNLLENAARYTPVGSPLEIAGHVEGDQVVISISDHGPGIPQSEVNRIFDKFYRVSQPTDRSTQALQFNTPFVPQSQGTGLGLAVCRGFIQAHNGRIWVENRETGGATFLCTLPLRQKRDTT